MQTWKDGRTHETVHETVHSYCSKQGWGDPDAGGQPGLGAALASGVVKVCDWACAKFCPFSDTSLHAQAAQAYMHSRLLRQH